MSLTGSSPGGEIVTVRRAWALKSQSADMTRRNPLLTIALAIAILIVLDVVLSRFWPRASLRGWAGDIIVVAVIGYIVGSILIRNGVRLPSLPKRRRMRVVKRDDPSKAASDFIKQFEERRKR